ncbi:MAG: hypothetical protein WA888_04895 [Burkholderiaceae bacterium]
MYSLDSYRFPFRLTKFAMQIACVVTTSVACATSNSAGPEQASQGSLQTGSAVQTYHWYDGGKRRSIRMAPEFIADFERKDVIQKGGSSKSAREKSSPVFVDANNQTSLRALPGGVIVRFKRVMSQAQANGLLRQFDTNTIRQIGSTGKTWLVSSSPGLPGLELANEIYESGLVQSASPNWWQQRKLK